MNYGFFRGKYEKNYFKKMDFFFFIIILFSFENSIKNPNFK